MLARKPRKFDYNLSPIRPLRDLKKELKNLKMGCASSQVAARGAVAASTTEDGTTTATTHSAEPIKYPPAESFEIPLDDEGGQVDSIIKKHPPKRLQRLTEIPVAPTTIEDLEDKLAKAEIRRKNYLQQKIEGLTTLTRSRDPDGSPPEVDAPGDEHQDHDQAQDETVNSGGPNGNLEGVLPNGEAQQQA